MKIKERKIGCIGVLYLFLEPDGLQISYFVINVQDENDIKILKWREDNSFLMESSVDDEFKMINHPKPGEDFYDYHIITPELNGHNHRLLDPAIYKRSNGAYYLFAAQRKDPIECKEDEPSDSDYDLESYLVWSQYFNKKSKNKNLRNGKDPKD